MSILKTILYASLLVSVVSLSEVLLQSSYAGAPADENGALIMGEAGEKYPIYGIGGIKVTGGHHGMWMSNMKHSPIEIDGSAISSQKFSPAYKNADFNASLHSANFVSQSAVGTLPPAIDSAGEEIIVCNVSDKTTINYQTSPSDKLIAATLSSANTNSTFGKVDRFICDGRAWYRE